MEKWGRRKDGRPYKKTRSDKKITGLKNPMSWQDNFHDNDPFPTITPSIRTRPANLYLQNIAIDELRQSFIKRTFEPITTDEAITLAHLQYYHRTGKELTKENAGAEFIKLGNEQKRRDLLFKLRARNLRSNWNNDINRAGKIRNDSEITDIESIKKINYKRSHIESLRQSIGSGNYDNNPQAKKEMRELIMKLNGEITNLSKYNLVVNIKHLEKSHGRHLTNKEKIDLARQLEKLQV